MKVKQDSTKLAEKALQRAAIGVLGEAVRNKNTIPIWDGEKTVWKIPEKEFKQVNEAYAQQTPDTT